MSKKPYYHFILFGSEGCEGYQVVRDYSKISCDTINNMELRARINSHRNIKAYAFKSETKIPIEAINEDFLQKEFVVSMF